jgi:hypothetical protein
MTWSFLRPKPLASGGGRARLTRLLLYSPLAFDRYLGFPPMYSSGSFAQVVNEGRFYGS